MKVKILWLSKHSIRNNQHTFLEREFQSKGYDGLDIVHIDDMNVNTAKEIVALMKKHKCTEVVTVLPLPYMRDLVALGVKPLRSYMESRTVKNGTRRYVFLYFERIVELTYKTQPV